MKRRNFLAAALVAPTLWIPRVSRGATPRFGTIDHVLVLFAKGGLRSHAVFNAVGSHRHNPWATQPVQSGTAWKLGAACGAADIATSSFGIIPGLAKVTNDVAVLACVDHTPSAAPDDGHDSAAYRMAGGDATSEPGLLTRIGRDLPRYANGFSLAAMPPVEISASEFGTGQGEWARARPIQIRDPAERFGTSGTLGKGWKIAAREANAARFVAGRPSAYQNRIAGYNDAKHNTAVFAPVLGDPLIDVLGSAATTAAGVSNGQLIEVLGNYLMDEVGDPQGAGTRSFGSGVALALRFFQFGSPMAVVTRAHFDLHINEDKSFPPRTADLVRQLAGLRFLLKQMTHPKGGAYWDRTVVTVVSEFSRNNTTDATGFNSGRGSDHNTDQPNPFRNQAIAVMGGPIRGGQLFGSTDAAMAPTGTVYSSRRLLSTVMDLVGLSHTPYWSDTPIAELLA